MKVFLDVDGTIFDIRERYFRVFSDCIEKGNISFEQYKRLKLRYIKDGLVAQKANITLRDDYFERKKDMLENEKYLKYDKIIADKNILKFFTEKYGVCLLSKRRYKENLSKQLNNAGIGYLTRNMIVLDWGKNVKKNYIASHFNTDEVIIIGDGEEEIAAAELENVKLILVKSGLYVPKHSAGISELNNINDIISAIEQIT